MMVPESGHRAEITRIQKPERKPDPPRIKRLLTKPDESPFNAVDWEFRTARITDSKGATVFEQTHIQSPSFWSQLATDIVASKYFRGTPGTAERETSIAQVIARVVDTITESGLKQGYFDSPGDAEIFHDELTHLILHQMGTFNSPVWFNVGVSQHPQGSACFILSVEDDLGSIMDLATKEARAFKGGSGTGANLSALRSKHERLSGGGTASGPLSFMRIFDAVSHVVKSGGKTRRAASLIVLDVDHPDVIDFIQCKGREEKKAWALVDAGYDGSIDGEAYSTVAFQDTNNSVRLSDEFMQAVMCDGAWNTIARTTGEVVSTHKARDILAEIAKSAHQCGDPGVQFDTTINRFNTCKNSGRINGTNACAEFNFLDNSACNLASLNLMKFLGNDGSFMIREFEHAVDIFITAQDILIDMSSYPTPEITENSHRFRPLGLNFTNLGALLIAMGLPYDSPDGRETAASITALMTGRAYLRSTELAQRLGAFEGYAENEEPMQEVVNLHMDAVRQLWDDMKDIGSGTTIVARAWDCWQNAKSRSRNAGAGFRNAQTSLLAPTGTISFMMDCDTTGVEPEFALVKTKNLVGGGSLRTVNKTIPQALGRLGYSDTEVSEITAYIDANGTPEGMPLLKKQHLPIFDCAATPLNGTRSIAPMGHIDMVAAVQPFLSGSVSKTINLPNSTTPEEIADLYTKAWQKGIKAMAVYRDGSKRIQPLQTKDANAKPVVVSPEIAPMARRKRLPKERVSITHKFSISGYEGYVTIGQYEDGTPGEMFIRMAKAGSVISGLMDGFALSISMALQYGVPLDVLCDKYTHTRFEPSGFTTNEEIPMATSILDYIFRWVALKYLSVEDAEDTPLLGVPAPVQQRLTDIGYLGKSHKSQMDGPACPRCGAIMNRRTGTCYTCDACGTSGGCG
jgi:ribonucleoside-diphosphate reductase alpha chain